MKLRTCLAAFGLLLTATTWSQSKIFKEVNEEISSQMKIISQDEALMGYLVFTQLEKATKDSFNYQVTIMDENLNEIGKLDFREKNLQLQAVSFEQDILCLAYLKSDLADLKGTSMKTIRRSAEDGSYALFTQLIDLQGKIIHSNSQKLSLSVRGDIALIKSSRPATMAGTLKHPVILKNIPGKGFILFYGDNDKNRLIALDAAGKELWQKTVNEAQAYGILTAPAGIYLLSKKKDKMLEGGYSLTGYQAGDGTASKPYSLKDEKGNELKVLSFENDAVTGKPFITGMIINSRLGNNFISVRDLHKGTYDGVFTIAINGPGKSDIKEYFSYWKDGSKAPEIGSNGKLSTQGVYPRLMTTVRDFQGNTYFVGSGYTRKTRVGAIASSVIFSPLLFPPMVLLAPGTHKSKQTDIVLLKQDSAGRLRVDNSIPPAGKSRYIPSKAGFQYYDSRGFYTVMNAASRSNFLIVDEADAAVIYNVEKRQIVRRVPHRDGSVSTYIYPAKEGHIMVMEFDRKARQTKLSIEALQ
ncbi:MAG TPA: DUF6770 family protein [Flavisolibacter sp.]|nr:DUF6770 family protein [Flavisolibacter sp.]